MGSTPFCVFLNFSSGRHIFLCVQIFYIFDRGMSYFKLLINMDSYSIGVVASEYQLFETYLFHYCT